MFLLHPLSIALLRGQIGACSVHHISHFIHYSFNALAVWYVADIFGCVVGCLMNSKLINAAQRKHSDGRLGNTNITIPYFYQWKSSVLPLCTQCVFPFKRFPDIVFV